MSALQLYTSMSLGSTFGSRPATQENRALPALHDWSLNTAFTARLHHLHQSIIGYSLVDLYLLTTIYTIYTIYIYIYILYIIYYIPLPLSIIVTMFCLDVYFVGPLLRHFVASLRQEAASGAPRWADGLCLPQCFWWISLSTWRLS